MKAKTKRILEAAILLAIVMVFGNAWYEHRCNQSFQAQCLKISARVNQAILEKLGITADKKFIDLSAIDPEERSAITEWNDQTGPFREIHGFIAVEDAPNQFKKQIPYVKNYADKLHQELEKGFSLLPSLTHLNFDPVRTLAVKGDQTRSEDIANFINSRDSYSDSFNAIVSSLQYLAQWEWLHGERNQAVERLADLIRLGQTLKNSPYPIDHIKRSLTIDKVLEGFDQFVWTNPGLEQDRRILEILKSLDSETLQIPSYVGSLAMLQTFLDWGINQPGLYVDGIAAGYLLSTRIDQKYQKRIKNMMQNNDRVRAEQGIRYFFYVHRWNTKLNQWTTVPAEKKRLRQNPNKWFTTDPFLPDDLVAKIPQLEYYASRYHDGLFPDNNIKYRSSERAYKAALLRAVYWARVYHDQNGKWPEEDEFLAQYPKDKQMEIFDFKYSSTTSNSLLINEYCWKHVINKYDANFHWETFLNMDMAEQNEVDLFDNSRSFSSDMTGKLDEQARWSMSILGAMSPLVESVTAFTSIPSSIQDHTGIERISGPEGKMTGMYKYPLGRYIYVIKLHHPQKTYWIRTSPLEVRQSANWSIDTDHSYQLVGWDG